MGARGEIEAQGQMKVQGGMETCGQKEVRGWMDGYMYIWRHGKDRVYGDG